MSSDLTYDARPKVNSRINGYEGLVKIDGKVVYTSTGFAASLASAIDLVKSEYARQESL